MFKGAWAIKAPGVFKRIPSKYTSFATYKKREAYGIGVAALLFGTLTTCAVAALRRIALSAALIACLRWQGTATAAALAALLFV